MKNDYFICIIIFVLLFSGRNPATIKYHSNLPLVEISQISCDTENSVNWLARLIFAESGIENDCSKYATASVVVNRARFKSFSIAEAIFEKGKFDAVNKNNWKCSFPNQYYEKIALDVICGNYESNYYWYANPSISTDTTFIKWLFKGKGKYLGKHYYKER